MYMYIYKNRTKEIEKHQRKMNQILLEERQLHGRSVEKLMSEKRNLEISEYKTRLEKDALEELVRVLTNEKQGLERGLEGLQKKQADQSIQVVVLFLFSLPKHTPTVVCSSAFRRAT